MCTLLVLHRSKYTSMHLATSEGTSKLASSFQRDSSRYRPGCRSRTPIVRVCFLGRPSQARRPPDASESPWSESPARRPRLSMLETWCHGLPGPRSVQPLRPSGVVGSRARLPAARVGGGVVSFNFVVASRSQSPRFRFFGPMALRRLAGDGTVCRRARNGLAWPAC